MKRPVQSPPNVGDMLTPDPIWNKTEPQPARKMPAKCRVEAVVRERNCQTGYMVTVRSLTGAKLHLSFGWFLESKQ